jgi:hypothetical protein
MKTSIIFLPGIFLAFVATAQHKYFGRHLVSATAQVNNTGPGYGLRYEYFLKHDKLSLYLPLQICYTHVRGQKLYRPGGIKVEGKDQWPAMYFVSPGFNFYPTRSSGTARYALGMQLIIGGGMGRTSQATNGTYGLQSRAIAGVSIVNGVHFHTSRHVRSGLELSLGMCEDNGVDSEGGGGLDPFAQLTLSLGGRF